MASLQHKGRLWLVHFYFSIFPAISCSLSGPQLYRSPVVAYFDRGHPCSGNFNSTIKFNVFRVKAYVESFLYPTCLPARISINKLDLVPARVSWACSEQQRSWHERVVSFDPLLHRLPCFPDVDVATLTGNPVDTALLFGWVDAVLWSQ